MDVKQCFLCMALEKNCPKTGKGRIVKDKGKQTLKALSTEALKDFLHTALGEAILEDTEVWVENGCYKSYTDGRNLYGCEATGSGRFSRSKSTRIERSFDYKTHCLICEEILEFEKASKYPDNQKYQISVINWINQKTKKSKLHETLKWDIRSGSKN